MADDRQANLTLFAKVDEAQIQRSIKRFRDLHSVEKDVVATNKQMGDSGKKAASDLLPLNAVQERYIANLKQRVDLARKEIELSQQQSRTAREEKKARDEAAKAAKAQSDASRKRTTAVAGATSALGGLESIAGAGPGGDILRAVSSIARLKTQIDQFAAASESAAGTAGEAATGMAGVGSSLAGLAAAGAAAVFLAAMSIAIQKFIEDLNRQQQALTQAINAQVKYHELVISGNKQEIEAEMKRLDVKRQALEMTIQETEATFNATIAHGGLNAVIANWIEVWGKNIQGLKDDLTGVNIELDAYKRALKSDSVQQRAAQQTTQDLAKATKNSTTAIDEAKRKEEERAKAIQQAAQDIAQARMREAQAEAEANQKHMQRLEDIARSFAQSSADALRKLKVDNASMVEKFGQEQADIILNSQREEEQAAREHVRNIKNIQNRARRDEFEASLSLDFARIAAIRRDAAQEVDETSQRFAAEREEANLALKQRLQDAAVAFQRERAARLQDYKNQLVDLRIARARQQEEARIAHQREIANLRQRLQDEINLKNSALQATLAATRSWASAMRAAVGGAGGITRRASGGPLSAYQTAIVNERAGQRESFVSGGSSVMLPSGMGIFTPFRGGSVSNSSSVGPVSIVINESRNPRETQAMIDRAIKRLVQ